MVEGYEGGFRNPLEKYLPKLIRGGQRKLLDGVLKKNRSKLENSTVVGVFKAEEIIFSKMWRHSTLLGN